MEIRPGCPYCKSIRISGNEWRINGLPQQFWCRSRVTIAGKGGSSDGR